MHYWWLVYNLIALGQFVREIHLRWTAQTVANSEYAPIAEIAHSLEVVGHLDIGEKGIRQLIFPHFCEGKGPSDLNDVPFLNVESELDGGQSGYLVVWNSHPLSIAAIHFSNIHILPPYTYGGDGIDITVRGVPSGISQFLKTCRALLPPDTVKVIIRTAPIATPIGNGIPVTPETIEPMMYGSIMLTTRYSACTCLLYTSPSPRD